jgi:hypothetical protein
MGWRAGVRGRHGSRPLITAGVGATPLSARAQAHTRNRASAHTRAHTHKHFGPLSRVAWKLKHSCCWDTRTGALPDLWPNPERSRTGTTHLQSGLCTHARAHAQALWTAFSRRLETQAQLLLGHTHRRTAGLVAKTLRARAQAHNRNRTCAHTLAHTHKHFGARGRCGSRLLIRAGPFTKPMPRI